MHAAAFCDKHHRLDFPSPELTSVSCISAGSRSSASADDTSVALSRQKLPQNCNREEFELWRQDVAVLEALLTSPTQERHKCRLPCGLHVDGKWEGEQEDQGWWKRYEMQATRLRDRREEMLDRLRREACARPEPLTDRHRVTNHRTQRSRWTQQDSKGGPQRMKHRQCDDSSVCCRSLMLPCAR